MTAHWRTSERISYICMARLQLLTTKYAGASAPDHSTSLFPNKARLEPPVRQRRAVSLRPAHVAITGYGNTRSWMQSETQAVSYITQDMSETRQTESTWIVTTDRLGLRKGYLCQ